MFTVSITDHATPALTALYQATASQGTKVMGHAVGQLVKRHLVNKNQEPNKMGAKKTGFYGRAAESVNTQSFPDRAEVHISLEGFRMRVEGTGYLPGGVLKPVNKELLTIPVNPNAYGKRAREIPGLQMVIFGKGQASKYVGALIPDGETISDAYYMLAKWVKQNPDPSVLPTEQQIGDTATQAIDRLISRQAAL